MYVRLAGKKITNICKFVRRSSVNCCICIFVLFFLSQAILTYSKNGEQEKENEEHIEKVLEDKLVKDDFQSRRKKLRSLCGKYTNPVRIESLGIDGVSSRLSHFLIFDSGTTKFMFCLPLKTASNTVDHHIRTLRFARNGSAAPKSEASHDQLLSRDCKWPNCFKNFTKVVIVRHPLERLVSAWRFLYDRKHLKFNLNRRLSWKDFVGNILNPNLTDSNWQDALDKAGSHWEPYWRYCSPCNDNLAPNWIIRTEQLQEDLESLWNIHGIRIEPTKLENFTKSQGIPTKVLTKKLLKELSKQEVEGLIELYQFDLEAFSYDPNLT